LRHCGADSDGNVVMRVELELEPEEIEMFFEGLDCLKTKISFTKGTSYAQKTERLLKVEALEGKLREVVKSK
jgi:hypothetical protein